MSFWVGNIIDIIGEKNIEFTTKINSYKDKLNMN